MRDVSRRARTPSVVAKVRTFIREGFKTRILSLLCKHGFQTDRELLEKPPTEIFVMTSHLGHLGQGFIFEHNYTSELSLSIADDSVRVQAHDQRQRGGGEAAQQPRLLQHSEAVLSLGGHSDSSNGLGSHPILAEVHAGPGLHQVKGVQAQAAEDAQTTGRVLRGVLSITLQIYAKQWLVSK